MKGLFVRLYLFILICFWLSNYFSSLLLEAPYQEDAEKSSINYAETLTESILREYKISNTDPFHLMQWWTNRSLQERQEIKNIELIDSGDPRIRNFLPITQSKAINISITEMVDTLDVVVPLKNTLTQLDINSSTIKKDGYLLFSFHAAYDKKYETFYYIGFTFIYLISAGIVYGITYYIYRYLQKLSSAVKSIADGHYATSAPTTSIDAFQALSNDIDTMSKKLKDDEIKQQIFNGAISHELRSPITRLQIALDILNNSNDQKTIKDMGAEMDDALYDLNHLTDNVLQLSKAYLQHSLAAQSNVSVNQTINSIIQSCRDDRIATAFSADGYLFSNPQLINTALSNLIGNACKYAEKEILISTEIEAGKVIVVVEDDGPGIPAEEHENIFQPFYRVDSSRSRQTGGSGLGLAIVHEIIRKTQGKIEISHSNLGGSCFKVSWPLTQA